ncbi:cytochrome b [Vibrio anguillarum]|uniref:cytochrome b n=1 Tax=Vibrio anguillarum TaxID=55601 RepID=UPI000B53D7E4|nr:cytochrome b [Vibrio anguillarum]ASG09357.1 cytochrome b [Vibrio anguillarum]
MTTEVKNYNLVTRLIHWLSALVIIGMFGAGIWMIELTYYSQWYNTGPHWHKSVGLLLLAVTLFRILWKLVSVSPAIGGGHYERIAAKAAHGLMYLLLMTLFVSGYLISTEDGRGIDVFNWFTVPSMGLLFEGQADLSGTVHFYAAWTLIILAGVHAVAALKHHFIDKDDTLRKMIGASK